MQNTKTFDGLFLRIAALLVHAVGNFILVSWMTDLDIAGSWLRFVGAMATLVLLSYFFFRHIFQFALYLKNRQP